MHPPEFPHGNGHEQAQGESLEDAKTFLEGSVGGSRSTLPWQRRPRREAERAALIGWAERNGKLFTENPLEEFEDKRVTRHGEHDVAYDEATGRWWKSTYGNTAGITADFQYDEMPPFKVRGVSATEATPQEYLQRMSLLNTEFGGTVELEGVWMDRGEPRLVVSQADVHGRPSETEEIAGLMKSKGYVEAPAITIGKPNTLSFINSKKDVALFDAHKGNFRTDVDGDVHVIDAVLSRVTPVEAEFLQNPPKSQGDGTLWSSPQPNEKAGQTGGKQSEFPHADQFQQPAEAEDRARSSGYVSRQLAEELSPGRKPHIYGQGFHSESEVRRQREKLIEIARAKGILLDAEEEDRIRRNAKAFDEGQEHEVFRDSREWVTKINTICLSPCSGHASASFNHPSQRPFVAVCVDRIPVSPKFDSDIVMT